MSDSKIKTFAQCLTVVFVSCLLLSCGGSLPHNIRPQQTKDNVAFNAQATANDAYNFMGVYFPPSAAVDGITFESHDPETFWLLPSGQTGFISIALPKPAKVREIRVLNTHNSGYNDRGTKDFHLDIVDINGNEKTIWRDRFLRKGELKTKRTDDLVVDRLNLYVDSYFGFGGGINEIEVIGAFIDQKKYLSREEESKQPTFDPKAVNANIPTRQNISRQNWAVIVGISKYKYSGQNGLTNLIFADDDAKAFANSLRNLGWSEGHIKLLVNEKATERNIKIALESWLTKAGPNDQIVLFWAGHGFPDPEDPEKVYFATYDTDISIPATGYRMDRVRDILKERKTKNVVILADTCHAGKLITRGDRGLSIVPNIEKMSREQKVPKGWVFMVGADTDRQAVEHTSWTNGAFTHSLIKGLSGEADGYQSIGPKDGNVTMGELRAYLNTAMPEETQKVLGVAKRPVITTSTGDPDIWNLTLQAK